MYRWMYNRVLDEVLIAGRTTKQENATYSQLAQYIVSVPVFSVLTRTVA